MIARRDVLARLGAALRRDRSGTALLEFAITLPVMLVLYLGGFQLMDAIACNRKVTVTARAAADLVSRSSTSTVVKSDIDSALGASVQIMYPYSAANALVRVTEITTDGSGNSTVAWSRAINGAARVKNAAFTLPASIKNNNTSLIFAEVNYAYLPPVASFKIVSPSSLTQTVYMAPRSFATLTCGDCP